MLKLQMKLSTTNDMVLCKLETEPLKPKEQRYNYLI